MLLYHAHSKITGHVLAQALGLHGGRERVEPIHVRWGNYGGADDDVTLNKRNAVALAADKLLSLQTMQAANISIPTFSTEPTELHYPFLGRNEAHTRGNDIVLCIQEKDYKINPRDYYIQYVPKKLEFRVHVFDGNVLHTQVKHLVDAEQYRKTPYCWNHGKGFVFQTPAKKPRADRLEQAVNAVKALGLDFGAVDMIVGDDDQTYILEVNSAPGLSPSTAKKYVDAIAKKFDLTPSYDVLKNLASEE